MIVASALADRSILQTRARTTPAILSFIALAFAWSWGLGWAAAQLTVPLSPERLAVTVASGFGPSLAGIAGIAVVAMFSTAGGFRDWMTHCLNWRIGGR